MNPRQESTSSEHRSVRQDLLDAAGKLLSQGGHEAASARAICAQVGVCSPTLYHYYGDVQRLHRAAIDLAFERLSNRYRAICPKERPVEAIRSRWQIFMHFAMQEPELTRAVVQHTMLGATPSFVRREFAALVAALERLRSLSGTALPPEVGAHMLWSGAIGAATLLAVSITSDYEVNAAATDAMLEALLAAILGRPTNAGAPNPPWRLGG